MRSLKQQQQQQQHTDMTYAIMLWPHCIAKLYAK
jgi:hypothetical protein